MSRNVLLVRHSDLRSSGRVIYRDVVSTNWVGSSKQRCSKASNITEDNVLLDIERDIIKVNGLSAHLQSRKTR